MLHPEFPIVSFLSVFLLICSAPSHFRARNVATISLILWLAILSTIRGINSIVWADNVDVKLLVWCDITTKIAIGFSFAVPASALCLMIRLESISANRSIAAESDKRRRRIFEFFMCFVIPIIFMGLHYIVQGHRFDIYQDQGCFPAIYVSLPAVFILWVPPLVFACISFVFAALSLRHFLRRRLSFSTHLRNIAAISLHRYFRLMVLALVEMIWDLGTNIWILWLNLTVPLRPWTNWHDVHSNFSRVQTVPYILLTQSEIDSDTFIWWILPVSCFLVFAIFGSGREAVADYAAALKWFMRRIFRREVPDTPSLFPLLLMFRSFPNIKQANDNLTKLFPFGRSTGQTHDGGSLSPSSTCAEVKSDNLDLPVYRSNVNTEPHVPIDISPVPSAHMRLSTDLGVTVSEPFSYSNRLSWTSDHAAPCNYSFSKEDWGFHDCSSAENKNPV